MLTEEITCTASTGPFVSKTAPFSPAAGAQGKGHSDRWFCLVPLLGFQLSRQHVARPAWHQQRQHAHSGKGEGHQGVIRRMVFLLGPLTIVVTAGILEPFLHISLLSAHRPMKWAVSVLGLPSSTRVRPQWGPLGALSGYGQGQRGCHCRETAPAKARRSACGWADGRGQGGR